MATNNAPPLPADDDGLITRRQLAALMGTTTRTLDKMTGSGQFPRPDLRIPDRAKGEPRWRMGTYRRWVRERTDNEGGTNNGGGIQAQIRPGPR